MFNILVASAISWLSSSGNATSSVTVQQWTNIEIDIESKQTFKNPYPDVEVWAWFVNDRQDSLVRPAFWSGSNRWKVRFAPPDTGRHWRWQVYSSVKDDGFSKSGQLSTIAYNGDNRLIKHGLLRMSDGKRNIQHADKTPYLLVGEIMHGMN